MSSETGRGTTRIAVVSTDVELRRVVKSVAGEPGGQLALECEVTVPFGEIDAGVLERLRRSEPEIVVLDLSHDPALGIRFAQYLVGADPGYRLIAVGPALSAEHLLEAMRAGVMEYLPPPFDAEALREAIGRVQRKFGLGRGAADVAPQLGQLFTFYSARGGSGATTCAINMAVLLRRITGKRVLLVDLDLEFGAVPLALGMEPRYSVLDVVKNLHRMDGDLLASFIETHASGVELLAAPPQLQGAAGITGDHLRRILTLLRQHYDYVLVDTARSFTPATLAGLELASQIVLVTTADLPALRNLKRCLPVFERITRGAADRLRLVVNRHHPKDAITVEDVQRALGLPVSWTLSNDYPSVIRSLNEGRPLSVDGRSGYVRDLQSASRELAGPEAADPGRGRLLAPLRQALDRFGRKPPETLPVLRNHPGIATNNG